MKNTLILLVGLTLSSSPWAGTQYGNIAAFHVRAVDGLHFIVLEGSKSESPSCATQNYWMIRDENSVAGKTQVSIVLAAMMADRPIRIHGTNTCNRWPDGEDIGTILIAQ